MRLATTLRKETKRQVGEQNGIPVGDLSRFFQVKYSTPSNLLYELHVSLGGIELEKNNKPLPQRGFPAREVRDMPDESTMVNLVTMQDGNVCPICVMIEKENPYSMEEFNRLRDVHPHLLNKNLRCRCSLVPFKPQGREPASGAVAHIDLQRAQQDLVQNIRAKTQKLIRERK